MIDTIPSLSRSIKFVNNKNDSVLADKKPIQVTDDVIRNVKKTIGMPLSKYLRNKEIIKNIQIIFIICVFCVIFFSMPVLFLLYGRDMGLVIWFSVVGLVGGLYLLTRLVVVIKDIYTAILPHDDEYNRILTIINNNIDLVKQEVTITAVHTYKKHTEIEYIFEDKSKNKKRGRYFSQDLSLSTRLRQKDIMLVLIINEKIKILL